MLARTTTFVRACQGENCSDNSERSNASCSGSSDIRRKCARKRKKTKKKKKKKKQKKKKEKMRCWLTGRTILLFSLCVCLSLSLLLLFFFPVTSSYFILNNLLILFSFSFLTSFNIIFPFLLQVMNSLRSCYIMKLCRKKFLKK